MPLSHNNAISVMVILQLTEVAEIENPGPSDYKPHEFFHARLACTQGEDGSPAQRWICSWNNTNMLHLHSRSR